MKDFLKDLLNRLKHSCQLKQNQDCLPLPLETQCAGKEEVFWQVCHHLKICGSPKSSMKSKKITFQRNFIDVFVVSLYSIN